MLPTHARTVTMQDKIQWLCPPRRRNIPATREAVRGSTQAGTPGQSRGTPRWPVGLEPEACSQIERPAVPEIALGQQRVAVDAVGLRIVQQVLSLEADTEHVVDFVSHVRGQPEIGRASCRERVCQYV